MAQSSPKQPATDNQEKLLPEQGASEQGAGPGSLRRTSHMRTRLDSASKVVHKALSAPKAKAPSCHKEKCLERIPLLLLIFALAVALIVVASRGCEPGCEPSCPDGWVGYQRKCYYFSEAGNWDSSRSQCAALGASLAGIDSLQELTFLMHHKGAGMHWVGLRREGQARPWKWANGTEFNNLFPVTEGADCAYLNDVGVSSSRCLSEKKWVCSKPSRH